jgi:hypothetical protein
MDPNKYSTQKSRGPPNDIHANHSKDFSKADEVNFKTYEEYDEEDYTIRSVEEVEMAVADDYEVSEEGVTYPYPNVNVSHQLLTFRAAFKT